MSEHLESSDSLSMDQNIQVHANHEGENQIYIPYWQEEGSSSTHLNHLMEEVRILKSKCLHLENHLEENHRQFSSLNQLYIVAQTNERKLLKQNEELRKRYRQTNNELLQIKIELENAVTEINLSSKRDLEWRDAHNRVKERQAELEHQLKISQQENDSLRKRIGVLAVQSQEDALRQTDEQLRHIDTKWKAKCQDVEVEKKLLEKSLDKCKADLKQTKDHLVHLREEMDQNQLRFQKEIDESREQISKGRSTVASLERQLKDLRGVLEDVSSKNDEYESENNDLKAKLGEQTNKSRRMAKVCKEVEARQLELREKLQQKEIQLQQLEKGFNHFKARLSVQEKQTNELQSALQVAQKNLEYLQTLKTKLRQDIQKQKSSNETEIQQILSANQQRIAQLKKVQEEQKDVLKVRLSELENQLRLIKQRVHHPPGKSTASEIDPKENGQLKTALKAAQARIQELQENSPPQCGHLIILRKDKEAIKALTIEKERLEATLEDQTSLIQSLKREILSLTEKIKRNSQTIKSLQTQNMRLEQAIDEIASQKDSLELHLRVIIQQQEQAKARVNQKDPNWLTLEAENHTLQQKVRKQEQVIVLLQEKLSIRQEEERQGERIKQQQEHQALIIKTGERISSLQQLLAQQQADHAGQTSQFQRLLEIKAGEIVEKTSLIQQLSSEIKEWQEKYKQISFDLNNQQFKVKSLQSQLYQARDHFPQTKNEGYYQQIIEQLKQKLKQHEIIEKREKEVDGIQQLEAEYQKELQALKRLIDYKGSKQDQRKIEEVRKDYETKIEQILREYERMQAEMSAMKRSVLEDYDSRSNNELGLGLQLQRWRVTVEDLLAEKGILVERVSMWESRYEQLRCLFEAKLESKEETINLLMLKISNLQMNDRSCRCIL